MVINGRDVGGAEMLARPKVDGSSVFNVFGSAAFAFRRVA
jgi:hypothetical protein